MTYTEALELIEQSRHKGRAAVLFGYTGGLKRYVWISVRDGGIVVHLFGTLIARIYPDDSVMIRTGGYRTATTREALNFILRGRAGLWSDKGELYVHRFGGDAGEGRRTPFVEGMTVTRAGVTV